MKTFIIFQGPYSDCMPGNTRQQGAPTHTRRSSATWSAVGIDGPGMDGPSIPGGVAGGFPSRERDPTSQTTAERLTPVN